MANNDGGGKDVTHYVLQEAMPGIMQNIKITIDNLTNKYNQASMEEKEEIEETFKEEKISFAKKIENLNFNKMIYSFMFLTYLMFKFLKFIDYLLQRVSPQELNRGLEFRREIADVFTQKIGEKLFGTWWRRKEE